MAVVTWKTTIIMNRNLWIVSHAKERTSRKMWSLPTREPVYLPRSPQETPLGGMKLPGNVVADHSLLQFLAVHCRIFSQMR